jgi:hypothetical protein
MIVEVVMKRKMRLASIAAILSLVILTGCSSKASIGSLAIRTNAQETPAAYSVISNYYSEGNINIEYPQISGLADAKLEAKINKTLRERAVAYLDNLDKEALKLSTLNVTYDVKLQGDDLISVVFDGELSREGYAHPTNVFYSANVGLGNAKLFALSDFYSVDKKILDSILYGSYDDEHQKKGIEYLKGQPYDDLLKALKNADGKVKGDGLFTYLTPEGVGFSFPTVHAIGDHVEYELEYGALASNER